MSRLLTQCREVQQCSCAKNKKTHKKQLYFHIDKIIDGWLRKCCDCRAQKLRHQTTWEQDKVGPLPSNLCALTGDTMCCHSEPTGSVNWKGKVRMFGWPGLNLNWKCRHCGWGGLLESTLLSFAFAYTFKPIDTKHPRFPLNGDTRTLDTATDIA